MKQNKDSLWTAFLYAILTRFLLGALLGSLGGVVMQLRRILKHLAEGDMAWPLTPIIMGAVIGALLAVGTTPRHLYPWGNLTTKK